MLYYMYEHSQFPHRNPAAATGCQTGWDRVASRLSQVAYRTPSTSRPCPSSWLSKRTRRRLTTSTLKTWSIYSPATTPASLVPRVRRVRSWAVPSWSEEVQEYPCRECSPRNVAVGPSTRRPNLRRVVRAAIATTSRQSQVAIADRLHKYKPGSPPSHPAVGTTFNIALLKKRGSITHLQQPLDQLVCFLDIPQRTISLLNDSTVVRIRRVPCSREPFLQLRVLAF